MLRLVLRNLLAHPTRNALTALSVAVAVCLLAVLRAGLVGLESAVTNAAADRLWVQSAVSLFVDLPESYEGKIESVEGTAEVCKFQWFGGYYRDPSNFFAQFGVDPDSFEPCYPELDIVDGDYAQFEAKRTGCVVGIDLMEEFGWSVGDTLPLIGTIFPRANGEAWEFEICAVYRSRTTALDQRTVFFDWAYLDESLETGAAFGPDGVGVYLVSLAPGARATQVMSDIDLLFENGPQRVQTTTEAEFSRQFVSMLGNVPALLSAIGGAVLFAIFFAVLNTMLAAARERVRTVGVVKALGFTRGFVVSTFVVESLLICAAGGLLGVGFAWTFEGFLAKLFAGTIQSFVIGIEVSALGVGIALAVGLVAGLAPATSVGRLTPVQALRTEG